MFVCCRLLVADRLVGGVRGRLVCSWLVGGRCSLMSIVVLLAGGRSQS